MAHGQIFSHIFNTAPNTGRLLVCAIQLITIMLIRKNTKAFKSILEIITTCQERPDRGKLIRLYITKAGHSIADRINVEGIQGESDLFYEMTYQTVMSNLQSSNHQLCVSDEVPGIYYFHSSTNKVWDEAPFEFDESVRTEFSSVPELPVVRKKEKTTKFDLAGPDKKSGLSRARPGADSTKKDKSPSGTKAGSDKQSSKVMVKSASREPRQPDFDLKRDIHFTNLGKTVIREANLSKRSILEYYNDISPYLLPHLRDRQLWTKRDADTLKPSVDLSMETLFGRDEESVPNWVKSYTAGDDKQKKHKFLCNDREHLLFFVESGSLQFDHGLSKVKDQDTPDYVIIGIDSPEFDITKALDVALATKQVLEGLQLRSCVKTDGISGLHVYIPLEMNSTFETSRRVSEYICKLVRLKIPDRVALNGADVSGYGKVTLDYTMNGRDKSIVAPYSLVPGQSATVATPLLWEEVNEDLRMEDLNPGTIFKRLKHSGDPLERLKKRANADDLLERLEKHYSFLF